MVVLTVFSFSVTLKAIFCRDKKLSGPDEFGGQYRQSDRDYHNRRSRQHDHGYSDSQDRESDYYDDQAFGLSQCPEYKMLHMNAPRQDRP